MHDTSFNGYINSATWGAALLLENEHEACKRIFKLWQQGNLNGNALQTVFKQLRLVIEEWMEGTVNWDEIATTFTDGYREYVAYEPPIENDALAILGNATINKNTVTLTCGQLERSVYEKVAHILNTLGGKWNKKAGGFVFPSDPSEQIEDVVLTGKVKKPEKYGFFPTPPELARKVVELADLKPGLMMLEPEAGSGNLADLAADVLGKDNVACCELQAVNAQLLSDKGYKVVVDDFMNMAPVPMFDRVVMNPPFERQQDISHVLHAWKFLKPGGKLVSIMSSSVTFRTDRKSTEFRSFVDEYGEILTNPEGSFKPSGTNVNTITVVLDKPADHVSFSENLTMNIGELFKDSPLPSPAMIIPPVAPPRSEQLFLF